MKNKLEITNHDRACEILQGIDFTTKEDMFKAISAVICELNKRDIYSEALSERNDLLENASQEAAFYHNATIELYGLLKEYGEWESMLIQDNALWWPYRKDDAINGDTYDKMMELQAKRNSLFETYDNLINHENKI